VEEEDIYIFTSMFNCIDSLITPSNILDLFPFAHPHAKLICVCSLQEANCHNKTVHHAVESNFFVRVCVCVCDLYGLLGAIPNCKLQQVAV
jgi:hypothetical protein